MFKRCLDWQLAEDLVQITCADLWEHRDSIRAVSKSLLYTTARNRWIDYSRIKRIQTEPLEAAKTVHATEYDPEAAAEQKEQIREGMRNLTLSEAVLVSLKARGWTNIEIGRDLGIPLTTVKRRYFIALAKNGGTTKRPQIA